MTSCCWKFFCVENMTFAVKLKIHIAWCVSTKRRLRIKFLSEILLLDACVSTIAKGGISFLSEILPLDLVQRISMVCIKSARAATGNLCQKAQVAKNGIHWEPDKSARVATGNLCQKAQDAKSKSYTEARAWLLTVGCFFQEQLTQESMEGVEAGEGETSWGRPGAQVTEYLFLWNSFEQTRIRLICSCSLL